MLSPQEKKVFVLLIENLRMKDIATKMHLDNRTIDTYATSIYKKFGVSSRIGLILDVLVARKHDLYLQKNGISCYNGYSNEFKDTRGIREETCI